jgi:hypothetical protein
MGENGHKHQIGYEKVLMSNRLHCPLRQLLLPQTARTARPEKPKAARAVRERGRPEAEKPASAMLKSTPEAGFYCSLLPV